MKHGNFNLFDRRYPRATLLSSNWVVGDPTILGNATCLQQQEALNSSISRLKIEVAKFWMKSCTLEKPRGARFLSL